MALEKENSITENKDDFNGEKSSPSIVQNTDKEFQFFIGRTFDSEEDAYRAYNSYAIQQGFGVRKWKRYYSRQNKLSTCYFVCSYEGYSSVLAPNEQRKRERLEYRCGCLARIIFKVKNGVFSVDKFHNVHNHPFVEKGQRHLISSGRNLTKGIKSVIADLVDAGVRPKKAFRFLANEAGGSKNIGCTEQDCHNYLQTRRANLIGAGDAQSLLNYFKCRLSEEADFFYTFQLDNEGRLCNFFWRDAMSKLHYECYGDVIIFDTTYRTNRYNMICAPFVGVNNHWKNIFFGCAFLCDETASSFTWLFKSFLESMGGKEPKSIFTDQDQAMSLAIKEVFGHARHRLCEWHIEKNAAQNIPQFFGKPEFRDKYFNKLLWNCLDEVEFESTWHSMVNEWECRENQWLQRLYDIKEKWSPAFNRDIFSADIKSTQRSESTNRVFNALASKTMSLIEFVKHYEDRVSEMREAEIVEDFANRGKVRPSLDCGILNHAASVYTREIFQKFQVEFLNAMTWTRESTSIHGSCWYFTLANQSHKKKHIVMYNSTEFSISCSCKKFNTLGLLCCHALHVLHLEVRLSTIPSQYILKRWTKAAKQGLAFGPNDKKDQKSLPSSLTSRLNRMTRKAFGVISTAVGDEVAEQITYDALEVLEVKLTHHFNNVSSYVSGEHVENSQTICLESEQQVLDPLKKCKKGVSNKRLKSAIEKKRGRRKKKGVDSTRHTSPPQPPSQTHTEILQYSNVKPLHAAQLEGGVGYQSLHPDQDISCMELLTQASSNSFYGHMEISSFQA